MANKNSKVRRLVVQKAKTDLVFDVPKILSGRGRSANFGSTKTLVTHSHHPTKKKRKNTYTDEQA